MTIPLTVVTRSGTAVPDEPYSDREKQRAVDFLVTMIESSGSGYWMTHRNYRHAGGELAAFDSASVDVRDDEDDHRKWTTVTPEMIAAVLRRVAKQEFKPFFNHGYDQPLFLRLLNAQYGDPDDFDFDADDADSVLQLVVLDGEIVYG